MAFSKVLNNISPKIPLDQKCQIKLNIEPIHSNPVIMAVLCWFCVFHVKFPKTLLILI